MGGLDVVFLQRVGLVLIHVAILHPAPALFHDPDAPVVHLPDCHHEKKPGRIFKKWIASSCIRYKFLFLNGYYFYRRKNQGQKKCPPPVREEGIFWSDVSVYLRPVTLVRVAVLPRLVVIIPLMSTIATF